jgi:hypothetical protein
MSGVIQRETSIAANATNDNLVSGSAFEFAQRNQIVSLGLTAAATGLFATIQAGPQIVLEESPMPIAARFPIVPDEFYYIFAMAAGDRLVVRVRNSTAGALVARLLAQVADA